jgi:hypothetical protein
LSWEVAFGVVASVDSAPFASHFSPIGGHCPTKALLHWQIRGVFTLEYPTLTS